MKHLLIYHGIVLICGWCLAFLVLYFVDLAWPDLPWYIGGPLAFCIGAACNIACHWGFEQQRKKD